MPRCRSPFRVNREAPNVNSVDAEISEPEQEASRPTWVAPATDFGHLQPVHDFLMNSASPLVTMVIFSSSSLFCSSSSPKSNSSFVVDFSFLPHHRLYGLFTFRLNMYSAQAVPATRLNTTQFISGFRSVITVRKNVETRGVLNERAACLFLELNVDGS